MRRARIDEGFRLSSRECYEIEWCSREIFLEDFENNPVNRSSGLSLRVLQDEATGSSDCDCPARFSASSRLAPNHHPRKCSDRVTCFDVRPCDRGMDHGKGL